jgi:hypothetical protein
MIYPFKLLMLVTLDIASTFALAPEMKLHRVVVAGLDLLKMLGLGKV